jgi:hypothetical protein
MSKEIDAVDINNSLEAYADRLRLVHRVLEREDANDEDIKAASDIVSELSDHLRDLTVQVTALAQPAGDAMSARTRNRRHDGTEAR